MAVLARHHLPLEGHIVPASLFLEVLDHAQQPVILHRQSLVLNLVGLNRTLEAVNR